MARARKTPTRSEEPEKSKEKKEPTMTVLGPLDQIASAYQKCIRAGREEDAVHFGLAIWKKSPSYAFKRCLVTAAEDVGLASPETVVQVGALAAMWRIAKEGSWYVSPHHFTMATILLCRAPKSCYVEDIQTYCLELLTAKVPRLVPEAAIDGHTALGRERGATWDRWYAARHVTFAKIPVNEWTLRLFAMKPEWRPIELREARDDDAGEGAEG